MAKDPGDQLDGPPRSNSRHHYREEVGLETGHKVARPDRVPEPLRKGMENLVSGGSVETFVQVPEVIQIQLHHQAVAGLPGGILGKRFDKAAPAQEAGQFVPVCLPVQLALDGPPAGQVSEDSEDSHRAPARVVHRDRRDCHGYAVSVSVTPFGLKHHYRLSGQSCPSDQVELCLRGLVDGEQGPPHHFGGRPSEQCLGGRVPEQGSPIRSYHRERGRGSIDDRLEELALR